MKLSKLIYRQIPSFIREEHPLFVTFLEKYYEFLEENSLFEKDYTTTSQISVFIEAISNELAYSLPKTKLDQQFFLQRVKELYLAKGSEESFKFLFRALFNKEVDIFYPSTQVLRTSDGEWHQDYSIFVRSIVGDVGIANQREVTVLSEQKEVKVFVDKVSEKKELLSLFPSLDLGYVNEIISAIVELGYVDEKVAEELALGSVVPTEAGEVYEIFIDRNYYGKFKVNDLFIHKENGNVFVGYIIATTSVATVQDGGKGFRVGNLLPANTRTGSGTVLKVSEVSAGGKIENVDFLKFGYEYKKPVVISVLPNGESKVMLEETEENGLPKTEFSLQDKTGGYIEQGYLIDTMDYGMDQGSVVSVQMKSFGESYDGDTTVVFSEPPAGGIRATGAPVLSEKFISQLSGFIKVDRGSRIVTGFGTNFTNDVQVNSVIRIHSGIIGKVQSIQSATQFTLIEPSPHVTTGGVAEVVTKEVIDIAITNHGRGYVTAPTVTISGIGFGASAECNLGQALYFPLDYCGNTECSYNKIIDYTTITGNVISCEPNSSGTGYRYEDTVIEFADPPAGGIKAIGAPVIDPVSGAITEITILNPGAAYQYPPQVTITGSGTGASFYSIINTESYFAEDYAYGVVESRFKTNAIVEVYDETDRALIKLLPGPVATYPGYYKNNYGFLSDEIFLQDGEYYQEFSYVVKSDVQLSDYESYIKTTIHPAGTALFGEYSSATEISTSEEITAESTYEVSLRFAAAKIRLSDTVYITDFATKPFYTVDISDRVTVTNSFSAPKADRRILPSDFVTVTDFIISDDNVELFVTVPFIDQDIPSFVKQEEIFNVYISNPMLEQSGVTSVINQPIDQVYIANPIMDQDSVAGVTNQPIDQVYIANPIMDLDSVVNVEPRVEESFYFYKPFAESSLRAVQDVLRMDVDSYFYKPLSEGSLNRVIENPEMDIFAHFTKPFGEGSSKLTKDNSITYTTVNTEVVFFRPAIDSKEMSEFVGGLTYTPANEYLVDAQDSVTVNDSLSKQVAYNVSLTQAVTVTDVLTQPSVPSLYRWVNVKNDYNWYNALTYSSVNWNITSQYNTSKYYLNAICYYSKQVYGVRMTIRKTSNNSIINTVYMLFNVFSNNVNRAAGKTPNQEILFTANPSSQITVEFNYNEAFYVDTIEFYVV